MHESEKLFALMEAARAVRKLDHLSVNQRDYLFQRLRGRPGFWARLFGDY